MTLFSMAAPTRGPVHRGSSSGISKKQLSLITLTVQNSILILITHYSRTMPPDGDHRYFASTAVFLTEVIKLAVSLTFSLHEVSSTLAPSTPATVIFEQVYNSVFAGDGWKLAIPATLYTLQSMLMYAAVENLDAVHFQIVFELKILATALFSVLLLGRFLPPSRWLALLLLTIGVSIVSLPEAGATDEMLLFHDTSDHFFPRSVHELGQLANGAGEVAHELARRSMASTREGFLQVAAAVAGPEVLPLHRRSASYQGIDQDLDPYFSSAPSYSLGLAAALGAAVCSALNGVYFEKVLKSSPTPVSIWTRNVQLSFYSLFPALFLGIMWKDGREIAAHGFFDGYNGVVWATVGLQAAGGLLASLCINYADNIAKNFATGVSIVLSFAGSLWFFQFQVTTPFLLGTSLVLLSTYLYTLPPKPRPLTRPSTIRVASFEKPAIVRLGTPRPNTPNPTTTITASSPTTATHETPVTTLGSHLNPMDGAKDIGLSTSRPSSPMLSQSRTGGRNKNWDE